jgi:hypothetical protein
MAVSLHWKLVTAAAAAAFALSACGGESGGDNEKDSGGEPRDSGTGGPSGSTDAGLFEVPIADLDDNVAGSVCTVDGDCKGTNGSCLLGSCTGTCENNGNCGAGGTCVKAIGGALLGQYGACAKTCSQKSDCGEGQDCREGVEAGDLFGELLGAAAEAGIPLDSDSGIDINVMNLPKTCGPAFMTVNLPDGVVGKPCTEAAQCTPGTCAPNVNLVVPFPNGYCSGGCVEDAQCGKGGVCYRDPASALLKTEGSCLLGCANASDCHSGLSCRSEPLLFENRTYCLPPVPDAGVPAADAGAAASDAGG